MRVEGGFYELKLTERISLLSLNTNLWYKSNKFVQDLEDPASQFSWLERILRDCETQGRSVIIFGHIPPGKFERFYQFCGEYKGCDTKGGYQGFHWMRFGSEDDCFL